MKNTTFFIGMILVVWFSAFSLRLLTRDIPIGITHDELDYVLNAKWFSLTGSDLSQTWRPFHLEPIKTATLTAELTPVILSLFIQWVPFTLNGIRIATIFIGSLLPLAVMLWLLGLRIERKVVIAAGALLVLNPWSYVFSHTAYEAPLSLLLHVTALAAMAWMVHVKSTRSRVLWFLLAATTLFLGFYSYHGFKVLTLPLVLVQLGWLVWDQRPRLSRQLLTMFGLLIFLAILLTSQMLFASQKNFASRSDEIFLLNKEYLSKQVDIDRRLSLRSFLRPVLISKVTVAVHKFGVNYSSALNPNSWWVTGEDKSIVLAINKHGFFYVIDIVLVAVGIASLLVAKKKMSWLLLGLGLVAPLPAAIQTTFSHALRVSLLVPVLTVVAAYGLVAVWGSSYRKILVPLLAIIYLGSSLYFFYFYTQQYPIMTSDSFVWEERVLSNYLLRLGTDRPVVVLTDEPYHLARAYAFYNPPQTAAEAKEISQTFANDAHHTDFFVKGVRFISNCEALPPPHTGVTAVIDTAVVAQCKLDNNDWPASETLAAPSDSRDYFVISGPALCTAHRNERNFVHATSLSDFRIEDMSTEALCINWTIPKAPRLLPTAQ